MMKKEWGRQTGSMPCCPAVQQHESQLVHFKSQVGWLYMEPTGASQSCTNQNAERPKKGHKYDAVRTQWNAKKTAF